MGDGCPKQVKSKIADGLQGKIRHRNSQKSDLDLFFSIDYITVVINYLDNKEPIMAYVNHL